MFDFTQFVIHHFINTNSLHSIVFRIMIVNQHIFQFDLFTPCLNKKCATFIF